METLKPIEDQTDNIKQLRKLKDPGPTWEGPITQALPHRVCACVRVFILNAL